MKANRPSVAVAGICMMLLVAPHNAEARGGFSNRGYNSSRAYNPNRIFTPRTRSRGNWGGHPRHYHHSGVRFEGRVIDPYKIGQTIDDIEVDTARLTRTVQRHLNGMGYYSGSATTEMTRPFVQALRRFQANSSGRSTGVIDSATLESLGLTASQFAK